MSMPDDNAQLRMMMRQEGDWWNAYLGRSDTMEGALKVGGLHMKLAREPDLHDRFLSLMSDAAGWLIESSTGARVEFREVRPAPEHERAGNA